MSEAFSRILIDKALEDSGWNLLKQVHFELSKKLKIARATVGQILSRLLEFKKIERIGLGRSTRYRKV